MKTQGWSVGLRLSKIVQLQLETYRDEGCDEEADGETSDQRSEQTEPEGAQTVRARLWKAILLI